MLGFKPALEKIRLFNQSILLFSITSALLIGSLVDYSFGNKLDYWVHDSAIVYQHRAEWKHSGIVLLDDDVPLTVGRKQAMPLFARAADRLIEAGAKGIFLDARMSKQLEGRMPYARCIEPNGSVQWSTPTCSTPQNNQCQVNNSALGNAPLKMSAETIPFFRIAPYLNETGNLPDFLLYDWDAAMAVPPEGINASDHLVTFDNTPIARWLDLRSNHAVYHLINFSHKDQIDNIYKKKDSDLLCNEDYSAPCRRIRLSIPHYEISLDTKRLILPVSTLASCDISVAQKMAALMKDRVIIFQTTGPTESTDLIITAMTMAFFSPEEMTPGSQYIIDAIETLINQDSPQPPTNIVKALLFFLIAIFSVLLAVLFHQGALFLFALLLFLILGSLCFLNPIMQLWPVTASMLIYLLGSGQILTMRLIIGSKEGLLLKRYIPEQVIDVLMPLKGSESFTQRRSEVVVLMSDLAGYTTVTGLLQDPTLVLKLMNDYLNETSYILQEKYGGVLEAYVGDMVCYYWEVKENTRTTAIHQKALFAGIELRALQKKFFNSLQERYSGKIDPDSLQRIVDIIDAGIGITVGDVVMGELGPELGVGNKKFGILGDPLNLAARIEGLTRHFNTDIIIADGFLDSIITFKLSVRRLGSIQVKGRVNPETLYALGLPDDPLFAPKAITQWEQWLTAVESGDKSDTLPCPDCYSRDKKTILDWLHRGLRRDDGVWLLDKK